MIAIERWLSVRNLDFRGCRLDTESMATTVEMTPEAHEQRDRLPKKARERVQKMLIRLEKWPTVSGVKKLTGNLNGWYRARVGDYRIRFSIKGDILTVDKIAHRKDVYED